MTKNRRTIRVRRAEAKDVVNICKLLKNGWQEQVVEYSPIDEIRGYRWILSILERGMAAVADLDGRIVGVACVNPYVPSWSFTDQWMLDMVVLYVHPSFRKEAVADRLIDAAEGFADRHGLTLTFTIQTGDRPLVKDRMMKQAGWQYVGGSFLRPSKKEEEGDGLKQERTAPDSTDGVAVKA